jgi:L-asparaginase
VSDATHSSADLPRVVLLATGGTIASTYDAGRRGFVPGLSGAQLAERMPQLSQHARIDVEQICNVHGADMTPELWLALLRRTREVLARPEVCGVVVTHGTDTLEETAYFLDLTLGSSKPLILVGALRPSSDADGDGPRNMLDAVRVATSSAAVGQGALVVMNGQIHAAREVTKANTREVDAFRSLEFGKLGVVDSEVRFYRTARRRLRIPIEEDTALGKVEILAHYAGADGALIDSLLGLPDERQPDGLVIAATGMGNVSGTMYEAIEACRQRGWPVVISTRVPTGRVAPVYASKGGGVNLAQLGCVFADNLSPHKARILLMLALTRTRTTRELQTYFDS